VTNRYYNTARREILPVLPAKVARLLDLGCGTGATVALVKEARRVEWAGGVEIDAGAAETARRICDRVWAVDAARERFEADIPEGSLDLVLALDILEHLADPWGMVKRLSPLVARGGRLMISVPNIRNWKFLWRLAAHGDFHYADAGILDRTHLRFFVKATAIELATCGGLALVCATNAQPPRWPDIRMLLGKASGGRLHALIAKQWLIVAERPAEARAQ
jgi:predicted TPR repeat methyltransferase